MALVSKVNILFISMVTVVQGMSSYQQAVVKFPLAGTYRNCDICSGTSSDTKLRVPDRKTCSDQELCRAVGIPGKPARARCINAANLTPAFLTPVCARGSGDTAITADGVMIECEETEDCPLNFVCTSGACCRDVSKCQKVGNCPAAVAYCGRDNICTNDSDCPGDAKCCTFPTCDGPRCIMPFFTGK